VSSFTGPFHSLLNDLLFHRKRGCIIEGTCPDCRQTFQPLEIESISEFVPEYQYRGIGDVHFVFDIAGLVGGEEDKSLSVVFELLNTHTMDNEKREYLNSIDIPWIESANERRRTDHSKCTKTGVISTFEPVYTTETVPVLKDIEIISKRCEDMLQDIAGKKGMLDDVLSFTRDIDEDC
jgi:hypothetical protein